MCVMVKWHLASSFSNCWLSFTSASLKVWYNNVKHVILPTFSEVIFLHIHVQIHCILEISLHLYANSICICHIISRLKLKLHKTSFQKVHEKSVCRIVKLNSFTLSVCLLTTDNKSYRHQNVAGKHEHEILDIRHVHVLSP